MPTPLISTAPSLAPPWYRDRWPWLLMLGPAIVVVAGFATLWLAWRSDDGLVADDYYKRGLAINQSLERGARAAELGLVATIDIAADGRVRATLHAGAALPPVVQLRVNHPTRAGLDRGTDLVLGPDGAYTGTLAGLGPGRWLVSVETKEWKLGPVESGGSPLRAELAAQR